jgi:nitrogen-specific signal transduction histidine kinase
MTYSKPDSFFTLNEAERLEKLRDYQILDTHSEDTFDKLALMASQIFGAQSAFIVFIDQDRAYLKSNLSMLPFNEVERHRSLSSLVILKDDVTTYNDTRLYPAMATDGLISVEGGVRFFAGAPLKTPEGYNVGAICVADPLPGTATTMQLDMLRTLSKIVIDKLENRLRYRKSIEAQINLMNMALHEIKNPLASINLANDIIKKDDSSKEKMTDMIKSSVQRIQSKLTELLEQSELEETQLVLTIEEVDIQDLLNRLLNNFDLLAYRKNQILMLDCSERLPIIYADKVKISDVLHNLVSNAIKYSYHGSTIKIIAREENNYLTIEVQDEGQGLNEDDFSRLFTKFAKLSSKPTGKETSNGLGLSITKSLIELHNGTIHAKSAGKDKGSSFIVSLPLQYSNQLQEELI